MKLDFPKDLITLIYLFELCLYLTESFLCASVIQDNQLCPDPASDHCVRAGGVSCSPGR